jgi:hypothetical protein
LDYIEEECVEANKEFEEYYRNFCSENKISISDLESKNKKTIKEYFRPKLPKSQPPSQDIVETALSQESIKDRKAFQRIFHGIAKKIHPDKFSGQEKTNDVVEKEELFKKASFAFENEKWGKLLEIAEQLDIRPQKYEQINKILQEEISIVNEKISHRKKTFGYRLYRVKTKNMKDKIIISFLKTVFNYDYKSE